MWWFTQPQKIIPVASHTEQQKWCWSHHNQLWWTPTVPAGSPTPVQGEGNTVVLSSLRTQVLHKIMHSHPPVGGRGDIHWRWLGWNQQWQAVLWGAAGLSWGVGVPSVWKGKHCSLKAAHTEIPVTPHPAGTEDWEGKCCIQLWARGASLV